jgi:hypothetical protein
MTISESTTASTAPSGVSRRTLGAFALATLAGAQIASRPARAADTIEMKMQFASPDGTSWNDMDRRFAAQIGESHRRARAVRVLSAELRDALQGLAAGYRGRAPGYRLRVAPHPARQVSADGTLQPARPVEEPDDRERRLLAGTRELPGTGQSVQRTGQCGRTGDLRGDGLASSHARTGRDACRPQGQGLRRPGLGRCESARATRRQRLRDGRFRRLSRPAARLDRRRPLGLGLGQQFQAERGDDLSHAAEPQSRHLLDGHEQGHL